MQISLEDSEWRTNIHGAKEHEIGGDQKGGSLLWTNYKLAHGLQVLATNSFLIIVFKASL